MKLATKAVLLSALVFPGAGQMVLKRPLRGLLMMLWTAAGLGVLVWMTVAGAIRSLEGIQRAGSAADLDAVAAAVSVSQAPAYRIVLWSIGLGWCYSVFDAWRLGRQQGR